MLYIYFPCINSVIFSHSNRRAYEYTQTLLSPRTIAQLTICIINLSDCGCEGHVYVYIYMHMNYSTVVIPISRQALTMSGRKVYGVGVNRRTVRSTLVLLVLL